MKVKLLPLYLMAIILVSAACLPSAHSASRPVINSQLTARPPSIDGNFMSGEWYNLQITFKSPEYPATYVLPTYVYFLNDDSNLYVLVDAVGDITNDPNDLCLLVFDFQSRIKVRIEGSSDPATWVKSSDNFDAAIGFGGSPNSPNPTNDPHKIYEFCIPFNYINAQPGEPIDFCSPYEGKFGSMPYDETDTGDNVWPQGLTGLDDIDDWGIIYTLELRVVGGVVTSINKLDILTPYLVLAGLVMALAVTLFVKKSNYH
ncbi:MAG: hypothetical protein WBF08_00070 [Candidatus Bathyarchaeia archaeon]